MPYSVGIIFSGPHADHHLISPGMDYEQTMSEFRTTRQQLEQGATVSRDWISVPRANVIALHVIEVPAS